MYAVIEIQGHQYIVQKGMQLVVDKIDVEQGKKHSTENVLMVFDEDGKTVSLGKPYIKGAHVNFSVDAHKAGEKMHVTKFKRKNRYYKKIGFRPQHSLLTITSIKVND